MPPKAPAVIHTLNGRSTTGAAPSKPRPAFRAASTIKPASSRPSASSSGHLAGRSAGGPSPRYVAGPTSIIQGLRGGGGGGGGGLSASGSRPPPPPQQQHRHQTPITTRRPVGFKSGGGAGSSSIAPVARKLDASSVSAGLRKPKLGSDELRSARVAQQDVLLAAQRSRQVEKKREAAAREEASAAEDEAAALERRHAGREANKALEVRQGAVDSAGRAAVRDKWSGGGQPVPDPRACGSPQAKQSPCDSHSLLSAASNFISLNSARVTEDALPALRTVSRCVQNVPLGGGGDGDKYRRIKRSTRVISSIEALQGGSELLWSAGFRVMVTEEEVSPPTASTDAAGGQPVYLYNSCTPQLACEMGNELANLISGLESQILPPPPSSQSSPSSAGTGGGSDNSNTMQVWLTAELGLTDEEVVRSGYVGSLFDNGYAVPSDLFPLVRLAPPQLGVPSGSSQHCAQADADDQQIFSLVHLGIKHAHVVQMRRWLIENSGGGGGGAPSGFGQEDRGSLVRAQDKEYQNSLDSDRARAIAKATAGTSSPLDTAPHPAPPVEDAAARRQRMAEAAMAREASS